jgi:hypothetical protein
MSRIIFETTPRAIVVEQRWRMSGSADSPVKSPFLPQGFRSFIHMIEEWNQSNIRGAPSV